MNEADIERHLVRRARAYCCEVRKLQWIGHRGAPDRVVMFPAWLHPRRAAARTVWVELKAPGKKAEPHQLREHERMRAMGQRVVVIDSLEGVDALFAE